MELLLDKVDQLLRRSFPGATTESEVIGGERVTGFLFWEGFDGEEQIDRQHRVWELLSANLTPEERSGLSAVFTLTPEEIASIRAG